MSRGKRRLTCRSTLDRVPFRSDTGAGRCSIKHGAFQSTRALFSFHLQVSRWRGRFRSRPTWRPRATGSASSRRRTLPRRSRQAHHYTTILILHYYYDSTTILIYYCHDPPVDTRPPTPSHPLPPSHPHPGTCEELRPGLRARLRLHGRQRSRLV